MKTKMIKVYVAGPYTKPDPPVNVQKAISVSNRIMSLGFNVFCPHLSMYFHMDKPREWEFWMKLDLEWIEACDCLYRMPGESKGADMEVEHANKLGIPVFYSLDSLLQYKDDYENNRLK